MSNLLHVIVPEMFNTSPFCIQCLGNDSCNHSGIINDLMAKSYEQFFPIAFA